MLRTIKNTFRPLKNAVQVYVNHYYNSAYLEWYFQHSQRLSKFKDLHQGEGCFIIGNGPSLNKMDLTPLRNYHTFGLNKIYLMQEKIDLNLSYHVAVNSHVIEQSVEAFKSLKCPSFLSYGAARKANDNIDNIYYIFTGGPYTFQPNILEMLNEGHTVTYVAMQIAFYMGFSKVFLIGVDAIDLEAAKKLGIYTSNTPDVFGDEVADVALGYLLLLSRQLHKIDAAVRQGEWLKIQGTSLRGKTAGIIGVGSIGKAIALRCQVLGMNLLGYDIREIDPDFCGILNLKQVELEDLWKNSDCILLACNLNSSNYHLLNEKALAMMKDEVWIINVARGPIIDQKALVSALKTGKVAKAALDVFESEPVTTDNPLVEFEQVILGSHNSSNTKEAVLKVNQKAIDNLVCDLKRIT